jgi:hypothetical protein
VSASGCMAQQAVVDVLPQVAELLEDVVCAQSQ